MSTYQALLLMWFCDNQHSIQIWEDPWHEHEEGEHGDGGGAVKGGKGSDGGEPAKEQEYQGGGSRGAYLMRNGMILLWYVTR